MFLVYSYKFFCLIIFEKLLIKITLMKYFYFVHLVDFHNQYFRTFYIDSDLYKKIPHNYYSRK